MLPSLKALAADLDVADFIEFTGRIPDDELIERLSSCDVCVNPDPANPLNEKSTMNKVLEYMALGRPIVQYDLKEGRYSAGNASLYATPNDISSFAEAIECLLADKRKCERMGAFGRFRMESELEWKHQIPKLLVAYDSVLNNGISRIDKTGVSSEVETEAQSIM